MAVWTRTGYCSDTSTNFNAFRTALTSASVTTIYNPSSGAVCLSVPGLNGSMGINANVLTETCTSLWGDDLDLAFTLPTLSVNGNELVPTTLQAWTCQDIGNATGGSAVQRASNGLYTGQVQVVGAGNDIWGTSDGFQFNYQTLTGDGTVTGRLTSMPSGNGIDPAAKAGLMMRNDLTPASMNAFINIIGTSGQRFSVRTASGATSTRSGSSGVTAPCWFKLQRTGNVFTGYSSPDGSVWSMVGVPTTIPMKNTIYVGEAVTSRNQGAWITIGFDSVGILQQ